MGVSIFPHTFSNTVTLQAGGVILTLLRRKLRLRKGLGDICHMVPEFIESQDHPSSPLPAEAMY